MHHFELLNIITLFCFVKLGKTLLCNSCQGRCSQKKEYSQVNCLKSQGCIIQIIDYNLVELGCGKSGVWMCTPAEGCWLCDENDNCNDELEVERGMKEWENRGTDPDDTNTIQCYNCRGKACVVEYKKMDSCNSTSCFYGINDGEFYRGREYLHSVLKDDTMANCTNNLCNDFDFLTVNKTNETIIEAGIQQNKNFTENVIDNPLQCYQCDNESCQADDEQLSKCYSNSTCFLTLVDFVEKRGCGNLCEKRDAKKHKDAILICIVCYTKLCNTNQERPVEKSPKEEDGSGQYGIKKADYQNKSIKNWSRNTKLDTPKLITFTFFLMYVF